MDSITNFWNNQSNLVTALETFIVTLLVVLQPKLNRILDQITSKKEVKGLFWVMKKVEDGELTKKELDEIIKKFESSTKETKE